MDEYNVGPLLSQNLPFRLVKCKNKDHLKFLLYLLIDKYFFFNFYSSCFKNVLLHYYNSNYENSIIEYYRSPLEAKK